MEKVEDRNVAWFNVIVGAIAGLIGALSFVVTGTVIFFSLRSVEHAKAEARSIMLDVEREFRKNLEDVREAVGEAQGNLRQTQDNLNEVLRIRLVAADAEKDIRKASELADRFAREQAQKAANEGPAAAQTQTALTSEEIEEPDASAAAEPLTFEEVFDAASGAESAGNWDQVISLYRRSQDLAPDTASRILAIYSEAFAHWRKGERKEALAILDRGIRTFGPAARGQDNLRPGVARMMVYRAIMLTNQGDSESAAALYSDVIREFADSDDSRLHEPVVMALLYRGLLRRDKAPEPSLEDFRAIGRRFANSTEPPVRRLAAQALNEEGRLLLERLNRPADAIKCWDEVVQDTARTAIFRSAE